MLNIHGFKVVPLQWLPRGTYVVMKDTREVIIAYDDYYRFLFAIMGPTQQAIDLACATALKRVNDRIESIWKQYN